MKVNYKHCKWPFFTAHLKDDAHLKKVHCGLAEEEMQDELMSQASDVCVCVKQMALLSVDISQLFTFPTFGCIYKSFHKIKKRNECDTG